MMTALKAIKLSTAISALCLAALCGTPNQLQAQFGDSGFLLSIGVGTGYSSHADSYQVIRNLGNGDQIREYSGYRIFVLESKLGWTIGESAEVYAFGQVSPGNSTITPYRSFYAGVAGAYAPMYHTPLYLRAGAGFKRAGIEKGSTVGEGILTNIGIGYGLAPRWFVELNTAFGKMDPVDPPDPDPFSTKDFLLRVQIFYNIF